MRMLNMATLTSALARCRIDTENFSVVNKSVGVHQVSNQSFQLGADG